MLFDQRPKSNRKDLYDLESELRSLLSAIKKGTPLVTIVGLRRTGKTSLLMTALNQVRVSSITMDLRSLASKPYATKRDLIQEIERALNGFYKEHLSAGKRLFNWLKRVQGIGISHVGISISWGGKEPTELAALFDELNSWAKKEKTRMVVAFDEAQELKKVAGVDMMKLFAHVYDYCRNITLVFTGSAIGLLYDFLGSQDAEAPLYGRSVTEIRLNRLSDEMSMDFLKRGFKQSKMKTDVAIIDSAAKGLGGIMGWLTLFGTTCVQSGAVTESAIDKTVEAGKLLAKHEFDNFLKGREVAKDRYKTIIQQLSRGSSSWSAIKGAIEAGEGKTINDRNITDLVNTLVKAGFVEKDGESYRLTDQMLAESFS
ncbi:MAG: AAA family ATPase [Nitrososphaerales archaeon]